MEGERERVRDTERSVCVWGGGGNSPLRWRIFGTRPKGSTPWSGRSVAHTSRRLHQQRQRMWRAPGEVQARPRAGSGGAGQTAAPSPRIRQAGDGEAGSSSPTRKATPARGKALGRHASAAGGPNLENG